MKLCATLQLIANAAVFGIDSILGFFSSPFPSYSIEMDLWSKTNAQSRRHIVEKVNRI